MSKRPPVPYTRSHLLSAGLAMYSFQNNTEHRVAVTGVDNVAALDGYVFQCVYSLGGTPIESNACSQVLICFQWSVTVHHVSNNIVA